MPEKEYIERETLKILFAGACAERRDSCAEFDGIEADCNQCLLNGVIKDAKSIPAADVRPVVLCRDCKYAPVGDKDGDDLEWPHNEYDGNPCPYKCSDNWYSHKPALDFFCAAGEKREES